MEQMVINPCTFLLNFDMEQNSQLICSGLQSFTKICQKILIAILAKHDLQENVSDTFLQISHKTNIKNNKII